MSDITNTPGLEPATPSDDHNPSKSLETPKNAPKETFYTRQFGLLCLSSFLFFCSFSMILVELPAYLTKLGGEAYKGYIIALFTLAAGLSRPFSGKLTDTIGRTPVIMFGAVVCFFSGFLYTWLITVFGFLFIRFIHGMSTGFTPTGTAAYVADVVPASRRGEAMGIFGLINNIGPAIAPALGSLIVVYYPIDYMFYCSTIFAALSLLLLSRLKETLPKEKRQPFRLSLLKINPRKEIIEPRVIAPAISFLLLVVPFGIVLTIIPDFSEHLGVFKSHFLTVFTLSSLGIRFVAGKVSDRFGRVQVIKVGSVVLFTAMAIVGFATQGWMLLTGAVFFGIAVGIISPTAFAWTIDLSDDAGRGKALATLYIALEAGIGLGAIFSAQIFNNNPQNFPWAFWLGCGTSLIAFIYLQFGLRKQDIV
ncbi:MAG TPA: MFS transporter [Microscillaceae bacterium]|nr:MFS transporter [Microscillaceae bacterium]